MDRPQPTAMRAPAPAPAPAASGPLRSVLEDRQWRSLAKLLDAALARARRRDAATLASLSLSLPDELDPSAIVLASRRNGEPSFLLEQPERDRFALAALGDAVRIEASGPGRFEEVGERWREISAAGLAWGEEIGRAGPVALGGFAFADSGGRSPVWTGFEPASLVVPELTVSRVRGRVGLTLAVLVDPGEEVHVPLARLRARVAQLRSQPPPLLDPSPTGRHLVSSVMPPEHYEAAVARAKELIRAGKVRKVVLSREVEVHAPAPYDDAAIFGVLREAFAGCFVFCVSRGEASFVAASPELLVRREGQRVTTLALAGSIRRSADPAVDDHLGEQLLRDESYREEHAIVARRIERTLRPHSIWVASAPEPTLAKVANVQHLATPIRAQLAKPIDALALARMMHPTPAVGGEPSAHALRLIPALEGVDRGWYAGPVGWTDAAGDGEFCVALRCALLRGNVARCFAGNGIVRDSDPTAELAETEIKLAALLPLLSG
ncbi:MAG: isochorismate synthase [Solirubrobacteraceae bacterium]